MSLRYRFLLQLSWYIGLIAFVGGWVIFLLWSGGRYINASDFEQLELIGFAWLGSFFWLSLLGLISLIIYVLINRKSLHRKMLFALLMLLINIPSVLFIIDKQGEIDTKVFVKLTNQSGQNISKITLKGKEVSWDIGSLESNKSTVFNYDPPFWNYDNRLYIKPDTLNLLIKHGAEVDTIGFPTLRMGNCKELVLGESFSLEGH